MKPLLRLDKFRQDSNKCLRIADLARLALHTIKVRYTKGKEDVKKFCKGQAFLALSIGLAE